MTNQPERASIISIVQAILENGRGLELSPRDISLLVLMRHEIEFDEESTLTLPYASIQVLHSRLDTLEAKDAQGSERRLNESLNRLVKTECISKADMMRLSLTANTEFQITPIGDSIAEWHIKQSELTGEPLTAIFRTFISQLAKITEDAEKAQNADDWHFDVVQQMQHSLKGMLVSIQRHQKEMDHQHSALRQFVPTLLTQSSETSIGQCEIQLSRVIATIDDLQEVVLASTSTAHSFIDRIAELAVSSAQKNAEPICDELSRRLQNITQWTTQRAIDWVEHHNVVHNFLRTVVRIDRQKRITDALKRAIAVVPGWTLELASEPFFIRMRDDALRDTTPKQAPRISREDAARKREYIEVTSDNLPELLLQYLTEDLANGDARASRLLGKVSNETGDVTEIIQHFPWLIEVMAGAGKIDDLRDWTEAGNNLVIEEFRVKS